MPVRSDTIRPAARTMPGVAGSAPERSAAGHAAARRFARAPPEDHPRWRPARSPIRRRSRRGIAERDRDRAGPVVEQGGDGRNAHDGRSTSRNAWSRVASCTAPVPLARIWLTRKCRRRSTKTSSSCSVPEIRKTVGEVGVVAVLISRTAPVGNRAWTAHQLGVERRLGRSDLHRPHVGVEPAGDRVAVCNMTMPVLANRTNTGIVNMPA